MIIEQVISLFSSLKTDRKSYGLIKALDIASFPSIMPVFIARRYMSLSRSADRQFHNKASHQTPLGAKVKHITHFFVRTGD